MSQKSQKTHETQRIRDLATIKNSVGATLQIDSISNMNLKRFSTKIVYKIQVIVDFSVITYHTLRHTAHTAVYAHKLNWYTCA